MPWESNYELRMINYGFFKGGFCFGFGRSNSDSDEPVRGPILIGITTWFLWIGGGNCEMGFFRGRKDFFLVFYVVGDIKALDFQL